MRASVSCDPRDGAGLIGCAPSRESRDASLRVTFVVVVVVVVSVCGSSSLFHFLLKLACNSIVAEIEIVVCRLKSRDGHEWLVQQERTPSRLLETQINSTRENPLVMCNIKDLCS